MFRVQGLGNPEHVNPKGLKNPEHVNPKGWETLNM